MIKAHDYTLNFWEKVKVTSDHCSTSRLYDIETILQYEDVNLDDFYYDPPYMLLDNIMPDLIEARKRMGRAYGWEPVSYAIEVFDEFDNKVDEFEFDVEVKQ